MSGLKICPNVGLIPGNSGTVFDGCQSANKRFYDTTNFCALCGTKLVEIEKCCENEGITDTGFCTHCGKAKAAIPEVKNEILNS